MVCVPVFASTSWRSGTENGSGSPIRAHHPTSCRCPGSGPSLPFRRLDLGVSVRASSRRVLFIDDEDLFSPSEVREETFVKDGLWTRRL
jgi:hypothetical protein